MRPRFLLGLLTFAFVQQVQAAGLTCEDIFLPKGLWLETTQFSPTQQLDKGKRTALTAQLLRWTGHTKSAVFSEKTVSEKGELTLAEPLSNHWSVEFDYTADHRGAGPVFRLKEISLVKPSGEKVSVDKSPLNAQGTGLKKELFDLEYLDADFSGVRLNIPAVIEKPLYETLIRWSRAADYIKREEVWDLSAAKMQVLKTKAFARGTVDYTGKIMKKQAYKFLILGIAMYMWHQQDAIKDKLIVLDPWPELKAGADLSRFSAQNLLDLKNELAVFTKEKVKLPAVTRNADRSLQFRSLVDVLSQVDLLAKIETKAGGHPMAAYMTGAQLKSLSYKKFGALMTDLTDADGSMAILFPVTERVVFFSKTFMQSEFANEEILPVVFERSEEKHRAIYEILKRKISSTKKESK